MNLDLNSVKNWLASNRALMQGAAAPMLVVAILSMMVLPLPPWMLDTFFTFNISVALMVMMVAAYMIKPLDFAAFPAVLLLTTLMRLSLNVASTRVVLLEGHTGPGAAGAVIEAFGHFLIGGNFAVGLIVFSILVVINFVVVTKGAERIAEVSARFALDAMPGKQMAVDADLNAGLIDEKEAKRRRAEVSEEADFFGSMDGASKFVRGDAVAGILILLINIFGGFAIGVLQHNLTASQAADTYILLAVGDALVAQIPGLLISVAAAMVVSRVGKDHDLSKQIVTQMFISPKVLGITATIMGIQGDLLTRIKGVRRKFAQEVGFLPPPVHVRDNLELKPSGYRITLRGVIVGEGEAFPGMFLAINPGGITTPLIGTPTTDPAFGLPAHWIDNPQKEAAQMAGFTVVDSETVMATHLSHLMQVQAARLLSRTETQQLVEHVSKQAPKLIEEVVPKMVSIAVFQKVLQLLLEESVHIRDIRTIIESLAEHAGATTDPVELARRVRIALSPAIVQQIYGPINELNVIAIDPALECLLVQALGNLNGQGQALDPGVADILTQKAAEVALKQEEIGIPACLLVPDQIRSAISRLVRRVAPRLQVLAHSEIPESHTIRVGPILKGAAS